MLFASSRQVFPAIIPSLPACVTERSLSSLSTPWPLLRCIHQGAALTTTTSRSLIRISNPVWCDSIITRKAHYNMQARKTRNSNHVLPGSCGKGHGLGTAVKWLFRSWQRKQWFKHDKLVMEEPARYFQRTSDGKLQPPKPKACNSKQFGTNFAAGWQPLWDAKMSENVHLTVC